MSVDVIAAPAKVVVGQPGIGRGQHSNRRARLGRRHHPREGEEFTRLLPLGMEIVETRARRPGHQLGMVRAAIAGLVPLDAALGIVAIGRNLHDGAWPVLIKPAQQLHKLPFPAITPEAEAIGFGGMDTKLGPFPRLHRPRPDIAQQTIGQQAELIGPGRVNRHGDTLGTKAILHQRHPIVARR